MRQVSIKRGKRQEARDKRQETSNHSLRLQWFSVGRIRTAGTHPTRRSLIAFFATCDLYLDNRLFLHHIDDSIDTLFHVKLMGR